MLTSGLLRHRENTDFGCSFSRLGETKEGKIFRGVCLSTCPGGGRVPSLVGGCVKEVP